MLGENHSHLVEKQIPMNRLKYFKYDITNRVDVTNRKKIYNGFNAVNAVVMKTRVMINFNFNIFNYIVARSEAPH